MMTISKGDRHSKATQLSNNSAGGGALNLAGEVQTVNAMMPIPRCLEMILLGFR